MLFGTEANIKSMCVSYEQMSTDEWMDGWMDGWMSTWLLSQFYVISQVITNGHYTRLTRYINCTISRTKQYTYQTLRWSLSSWYFTK